jgi:zinc/manganese transport system permease protein
LSVLTLAVIGLIYRPLLLSSFSAELTRARGINLRGVGLLFMIAMAVSVGLSSIAVGSILSTALLIGPAAASVRLTNSLRAAMILACVLGVVTTWLGILFAYDSFYWIPSSQGLPVSFFIVSLIFVTYLISGLSVVRGNLGWPKADHLPTGSTPQSTSALTDKVEF